MKLRINLLPGFAAVAVIVAVSVVEWVMAFKACGGEYIYPIDDTYIHMAMARALAEHGVWGVEAGRMAFCSSSPLWTLVLGTAYWAFGVVDCLPWILALGFNVASIVLIDIVLSGKGASWWLRLCGTLAVAVAGPFLCTTALGMEHAMHGFFILAAVALSEDVHKKGGVVFACACLSFAAATASRYESLFVLLPLGVFVCGVESFARWKQKNRPIPYRGIALLSSGVFPILAYGLWAISQGGHFLPNSLLLKGNFMPLMEIPHQLFALMGSVAPGCGFLYVLSLSLLTAACLPQTRLFWRLAALAVLIAIFGQMLFATVGQLCRYEAYLTAAGAFVVVASVAGVGLGRYPVAYAPLAIYGLTACVFLTRAKGSFGEAIHSSSDIRCQQVVMTRLLASLPEEDRGCVALNDLGYMAMYGGFPILDIWGLGSQDATEMMLKHLGTWERTDHEVLFKTHDVKYVAVFESWFPKYTMPSGTVDVAYLKLKNNFACGSDTVVFRAISTNAADRLERHLERCVDKLPNRASLTLLR